MKDLIQEGRKIQETFKKSVIREDESYGNGNARVYIITSEKYSWTPFMPPEVGKKLLDMIEKSVNQFASQYGGKAVKYEIGYRPEGFICGIDVSNVDIPSIELLKNIKNTIESSINPNLIPYGYIDDNIIPDYVNDQIPLSDADPGEYNKMSDSWYDMADRMLDDEISKNGSFTSREDQNVRQSFENLYKSFFSNERNIKTNVDWVKETKSQVEYIIKTRGKSKTGGDYKMKWQGGSLQVERKRK